MADAVEHLFALCLGKTVRRAAPYIWLIPAFILVGLLAAGMMLMVVDSFHQLDQSTFLLSDAFSLANYQQLLAQPVFKVVLLRSILYSLIVTAITVPLSFPYAYVMVRTKSALLRRILLFCLFVPFFIGSVVRAYSWIIVLGRYGLANEMIEFVGLEPIKMLYTPFAVVVGLTQYMLPFSVLMIAPALTSIPEEIEMAAEGLGASWVQALARIVFPMAKPGIVAATIVVFTLSLTDYAMPAMMGGGTFDFVSNLVYDVFFGMSDWGLGSAFMILLVIVGTLMVILIMAAFDLPAILKRALK
ncbi:ABC transporter permease [Mesorhizobium sp. CO1-1-11]|uniref:ABC transporter permease n=1 Tax=Mesorhizobium sp. CO1-1-11 TaxID=2876636 RepID=UPI001CCDA7D9|nr:ABC transporter permease [Mesorhizobium sp. CO1-1-11]MBZ9726319.1 ABC transporter permease [Mesorhizobium sp. CO1-1-11]